jgi:beta-phosphoglucomutase-like phosphatase (HAD superfamily)
VPAVSKTAHRVLPILPYEPASVTFNGIIFDFNGVLFFDAQLQIESWQRVAKELRGQEMVPDELDTHMYGRPNDYVLAYLAGRSIEGTELLDLIQFKESFYRKRCLMSPGLFALSPGARELLEVLTQYAIPRTIATSSEIGNLEFFMQHLQLDRWFDREKIVYDDGRRPGKPAPDVYRAAALNLRLPPSGCVVVEDAISGLASAHAAGIGYLIAMGASATHASLLARPGVALAIESLRDFPRESLLKHR